MMLVDGCRILNLESNGDFRRFVVMETESGGYGGRERSEGNSGRR